MTTPTVPPYLKSYAGICVKSVYLSSKIVAYFNLRSEKSCTKAARYMTFLSSEGHLDVSMSRLTEMQAHTGLAIYKYDMLPRHGLAILPTHIAMRDEYEEFTRELRRQWREAGRKRTKTQD